MPVQTVGALSPFPEPVLSPETTLNLKTHPNMLWSPAMDHCINGHWGKAPWLKSPARKGRKDAEAGTEIIGSNRSDCKAALGCWPEKGSFLTTPMVPCAPRAPAAPCWGLGLLPTGTSLFSFVDLALELKAIDPQLVPAGRTGTVGLLQGDLWCPSQPQRQGDGSFELLVELEPWDSVTLKRWVWRLLVSHRVAVVMITILQV